MSKGLRNYTGAELRAVVSRRLAQNSRGNGYWAARDAADKLGIKVPAPKLHTPRRAPKRNRDDNGDQAPAKRRHRADPGHKPFTKLKQLARS